MLAPLLLRRFRTAGGGSRKKAGLPEWAFWLDNLETAVERLEVSRPEIAAKVDRITEPYRVRNALHSVRPESPEALRPAEINYPSLRMNQAAVSELLRLYRLVLDDEAIALLI